MSDLPQVIAFTKGIDFNDVSDMSIIDIGGSKLTVTFGEEQLPKAFANQADFPKEWAYIKGMDQWNGVADVSYQTGDEMAIINATSHEVISEVPSGAAFVDLGAANSAKYEQYIQAFIDQGKEAAYIPLDLCQESLLAQMNRAKLKFPNIKVIGLWGSFVDGDAFFHNIKTARVFFSGGSILYNAPDEMAKERCEAFYENLGPADRLIVGQDSPATKGSNAHASYNTQQFDAFFNNYLEAILKTAGIKENPETAWTVESRINKAMHFFAVTATKTMTCKKFDDLEIPAGTTYEMFKSWKRDEADIHFITKSAGLDIKTIGRADNSGMRQYLVRKDHV